MIHARAVNDSAGDIDSRRDAADQQKAPELR